MKKIFVSLLLTTNVIGFAQAQLGMTTLYSFFPGDTVLANTTVTLNTVVKNYGNSAFAGTYTLQVALFNGTITPIASSTNSVTLNPNDTSAVTVTFTAQTGANGWKVAGNGNVIVVWPISNVPTRDSLKTLLTVIEPTGIHDIDKAVFSMYPNPVKDKVTIKNTSAIRFETMILYDVEAKEMEKYDFKETIDLHHLPKGIYWIVLTSGEKRYKQKIIKE